MIGISFALVATENSAGVAYFVNTAAATKAAVNPQRAAKAVFLTNIVDLGGNGVLDVRLPIPDPTGAGVFSK